MRLLVFDLDHTLLKVNCSFRFGLFLFRKKYFSLWSLLASLTDYAKHKWLGMSVYELHQNSFNRLFKNRPLKEINFYVDDFLFTALEGMLNPKVIDRLKEGQTRGDCTAIISSSPDFLVEKIAHALQVNEWRATSYQCDKNGVLSSLSDVMEGERKASSLRDLAALLGVDISDLIVYSDSFLDLPMLKIAGVPVGVGPDSRLKQICIDNGWEILY